MIFSLFWTITYNVYRQSDGSDYSWFDFCVIACVSFCAGMLIDGLLRTLFKTDNSVIADRSDETTPPNPFTLFTSELEKPSTTSTSIPPSPFIDPANDDNLPPNPFTLFDDEYEKPHMTPIPIPPSPFTIDSPFADQPAFTKRPIIPAECYNRLVDQILSICDEYKAKLKRYHNLVKLCEKNLIIPQILPTSQNKPLKRNRPCLVHVDRVEVDKYDALIPLHNSYSRKYAKLCETIRCNENKLRDRGLII